MSTQAKVICDSISPHGVRLTTMEVTFHRYILAEVNTHRALTRSSASSRAIPVDKMLDRFVNNWAFPSSLPREQPGMQGGNELEGEDRIHAEDLLRDLNMYTASRIQQYLDDHPDKSHRLHKSVLNRPMEWGQYHTAIITSTDWGNLFNLRCSPEAQPEFRIVADAMKQALYSSTPVDVPLAEWHLPYIQPDEMDIDSKILCEVSAARCARVSYLTHDGKREIEKDLELFDRLVSSGHWSPLEHCATPAFSSFAKPPGNFRGWYQLRHRYDLFKEHDEPLSKVRSLNMAPVLSDERQDKAH